MAAHARQAGGWRLYVEEHPLDTLPDLKAWRGDGILTAFTERRHAVLVRGLDRPVVGVEGGCGWYEPGSGIPYFATDDEACARMAADHLIGQGYSRLAFCGLPKSRHTEWAERRRRGFVARAREAGVPCHVYAGHHQSTRQWAAFQRDLCTWLRCLEKQVGIMAGNDARACHVLETCRTLGLRVPEELASSDSFLLRDHADMVDHSRIRIGSFRIVECICLPQHPQPAPSWAAACCVRAS